ncbi:MAG: hypothetical protein ACOYN3_09290 [Acidimicrobiia bacterium]
MPYVQSVTSDDDELDQQDWEESEPSERRQIPWIPIASAAGAVVLLIVLIVVLTGRGGSSPSPAGTTKVGNDTLSPLAIDDPRVVAAQNALTAWGVFEGSGNLDDLGETMSLDGPQYQALEARAGKTSAGAKPFTVTLANPRLITNAPAERNRQVVRADLTWKREGSSGKAVVWDITVAPTGTNNAFQLWTAKTVTNATAGSSSPVGTGTFCDAAKQAAAIPTIKDANERINAATTEATKVSIYRDSIQQRASAFAQLASVAPDTIRSKAEALATGNATYASELENATTLDAITKVNTKVAKSATYKASEKARPEVQKYVQQECGVDINPER